MDILLITVGNKMPAWVNTGFENYQNRLKNDVILNLHEITLQKRSDKNQVAVAKQKESEQVLRLLESQPYVVTLDISGKLYSSEQLAQRMKFWQNRTSSMALVIGGPEGLSDEVKSSADESWSLGQLTLPHPLARIVVAEALYRAWSINHNHPYHRA